MPVRPVLLALAVLAVSLPAAPAAAACPGEDTTVSLTALGNAREAVLCLVNEERTSRGLNALEQDGVLQVAAQLHSEDMALRKYFDHFTPDGRSPGDRIDAAGYDWAAYGENIAQGYGTPREVMQGWMNSPGHRANILSPEFTELGVGISLVDALWTQNFGRPRGAPAPDAPGVSGDSGDSGEEPSGGDPPADEGPAPSEGEDSIPLDGAASALSVGIVRAGRFLTLSGKSTARNVRVRVVQLGKTVARKRVRVRSGRYRVRLAVPSGAVKVIVRGGGRRVARTIA